MKPSKAYEIIKNLEDSLRKLIEDELSQISSNWWEERIPEKIREKAENRKLNSESNVFPRGQNYPKISYVDFPDYEKIITDENNWMDVFQTIFGDEISIAGKFRDLRPIRNDISHSRDLNKKDGERLRFIAQEIKGAIDYYLVNKITTRKTEVSKFSEEFNEHLIKLTVSSDRTVYPENAFVHVRANLTDIIMDKLIIFQIFNSNDKLIAEKQLDPIKYDNLELKSAGLYQITFTPSEISGKIGEVLYVKAKHGDAEAIDSWLIDRRKPVVQTDKSVYMINTDMIVTVIDPDSDKDSQSVEFVGDREDSKLIIESKYGKIEGYKLRETGDSTGIFQGIIGVLGIRKDGSIIENEIDGRIINKIQGTGIADGFIGGSLGDEIKITYKSKSGTASVLTFVSNFGAAVELDKKVYKHTDTVFITIVAPDLNFDSEIINEIGQKPESLIKIRTNKDEITNYKLVETGPDTGIFTGEIKLTQLMNESSSSQAKGFGPNDGKIFCDGDDFVEVSIRLFDDEEIVGRALIKS